MSFIIYIIKLRVFKPRFTNEDKDDSQQDLISFMIDNLSKHLKQIVNDSSSNIITINEINLDIIMVQILIISLE